MLLAISGCGGDDEEASTRPTASTPAETEATESVPAETATETEATETETETRTETEREGEAESPEDMQGGAGDESPARTLALFTGRAGRITPRVVRVPAFISVRVELRSADGATYSLRFGEAKVVAGERLSSHATTIDGLRPGESITGRPGGAGNRVRIEATAEPGP